MHQILNIEDEDFKKMILFSAFEGKALDMVRALGPEGVIFPTLTANEMTARIQETFQPEAESAMARQEFVQRKQSANENISIYAETKISLYQLAYPAAEANYPTLLTEFIRGIYNITIKKRVRQQNPRTLQELRNVAIQTVAIEREAFLDGYGESATLDGLSAVSMYKSQREPDEPMDISAIKNQHDKKEHKPRENHKETRICFFCERVGHLKRNCFKYKKWLENKKAKEQKGRGPGQKGPYQPKRDWKPKGEIRALEMETNEQKEKDSSTFLGHWQALIDAQEAAQRLLEL